MGPSGCGKTTLLHLITGKNLADSGQVKVFNQELKTLSLSELYHLRQRMGMLFQSAALFLDLTVFENLAFPLQELNCLPDWLIHDLVLIKLEAVGLRGTKDILPNNLSGGMKRRIALARAIMCDPDLLLLDEPFAGQDPVTMGVLTHLIKTLNASLKLTIVFVSHAIPNTFAIADYIYLIANGKIMAEGSSKELQENPDPWVQQFIHGLPDGPIHLHYPAIPYSQDLNFP